jgi:hypothetical protein
VEGLRKVWRRSSIEEDTCHGQNNLTSVNTCASSQTCSLTAGLRLWSSGSADVNNSFTSLSSSSLSSLIMGLGSIVRAYLKRRFRTSTWPHSSTSMRILHSRLYCWWMRSRRVGHTASNATTTLPMARGERSLRRVDMIEIRAGRCDVSSLVRHC